MLKGSQPTCGGNLLLSKQEKETLLAKRPEATPFIKPVIGSEEYINGIERYCLWLKDAEPNQWRTIPEVMQRIEGVKALRLKSPSKTTQKDASKPYLFQSIRQPDSDYIVVPRVSSESRLYIPFGFLTSNTIATDLCSMIPNATLYHFGVLTSHMHMAFMRVVCGRLEGRYRYSNQIVYNNFPWPSPSLAQQANVTTLAAAVLAAREPYLQRGNTLADLYSPTTMPAPLLKAHQALDKAVDASYRKAPFTTELERVSYLFERYNQLTALSPKP
jgi:hypothetical protein